MTPVEEYLDQAPGLSVLLLGAEFRDPIRFERLQKHFETYGLDSLCVAELQDAAKAGLIRQLQRDGESCHGIAGCEMIVVALNLCPRPPGRRSRSLAPGRDDKVPHRLQKQILADHRFCSHSWVSQNTPLAWKCIGAVMPEMIEELGTRIADLRRRFQTPFPVIAALGGYSANAKVELVDFRGGRAVCKMFKPGRDRFFQRELLAITRLSEVMEEIPPLLEAGENWLVFPYYPDLGQYSPDGLHLLPLDQAKRVGKLIEKLHEAGFAHLDLGYGNILFRSSGDVILIDFEYLHEYDGPLPLHESYDVAGPPPHFSGDLPMERPYGPRSYASRLMPGTGLSFESLRHDPEWRQHCTRAGYFLRIKLPRHVMAVLRGRKQSIKFALRVCHQALHRRLLRASAS